MMMKKVADQGFLTFWPFENEQKLRRKRKNAAKNQKFGKRWQNGWEYQKLSCNEFCVKIYRNENYPRSHLKEKNNVDMIEI